MSEIVNVANSSPACRRCEILPSAVSGPGVLHLRLPLGHTVGKVLTLAKKRGWECSREDELLRIVVAEPVLEPVLEALCGALTETEQQDTRILFQPEGQELRMNDLFQVESLGEFLARSQSNWLISLLREERLTTWFQPIVHCGQPESVFGYECLMRGQENGELVYPGRILQAARGGGLLFQLDRAARVTAISNAARFGIDSKVFINFTPTSIYDPKNCLQTTVRAVDDSHLQRDQIVFEVIESDEVREPKFLRAILDFYREQGFGVALDDVGSGYSSLNLLSRIRPDYIKLDREMISGVASDAYQGHIAAKILEVARDLGVRTVAEGVESPDDFQWLAEHGADYAQGYLFARPASPPPAPQTSFTVAAGS